MIERVGVVYPFGCVQIAVGVGGETYGTHGVGDDGDVEVRHDSLYCSCLDNYSGIDLGNSRYTNWINALYMPVHLDIDDGFVSSICSV